MSKLNVGLEQAKAWLDSIPAFLAQHDVETPIQLTYARMTDGNQVTYEMSGPLLCIALHLKNEAAALELLRNGAVASVGCYGEQGWFGWHQHSLHSLEMATSFGMVEATRALLARGVDFSWCAVFDGEGYESAAQALPLGMAVLGTPDALAVLLEAGWADHELWKTKAANLPAVEDEEGADAEDEPNNGSRMACTTFPNRAGAHPDNDEVITRELEAAGITPVQLPGSARGEVQTRVVGELLGMWSFTRAWCYWVAQGPGLPLAAAEQLHAQHGHVVRVDGFAGGISPRERYKGLGVGNYHVDTAEGLKALVDAIKEVCSTAATT